MTSQILRGETRHCRYQPRRHEFRYGMIWLRLNIDELPALDRSVAGFGYNRRAAVSIRDIDYAGDGPSTMREKVLQLLAGAAIAGPIARIDLITLPRILGYVFNPVSFFCCYGADGQLAAFVAEVHNTFGEAHHYVLQPASGCIAPGETIRFSVPKAFFVSPFLKVQGEYNVSLKEHANSLLIEIHLQHEGQTIFSADMSGRGVPLSTGNLVAAALWLPIIVGSVMLRISWQAMHLYLGKRLPVFTKPAPEHVATIAAARPGFWNRLREGVIRLASHGKSSQPAVPPLTH